LQESNDLIGSHSPSWNTGQEVRRRARLTCIEPVLGSQSRIAMRRCKSPRPINHPSSINPFIVPSTRNSQPSTRHVVVLVAVAEALDLGPVAAGLHAAPAAAAA
jgi:hypothetical protein